MLRTKVQQRGPHPLGTWLNMVVAAAGGDGSPSLAHMEAVMHALRAYQQHGYRRPDRSLAEVARCGSARLLDCGGDGPPVLFVPSLVNPSHILDLDKGRSLTRGMRKAGVRCLLLDWGSPTGAERGFSLDDYVQQRLLPLIAQLGGLVTLVGYCLGGTLCVAAARLAPDRVSALATLAAPWSFAGYGAARRERLLQYWASVQPAAAQLQLLPMEMLQPAFWSLDPASLAAKFLRFARLPADGLAARRFVMLEDWANSGPPLALPAAQQCLEAFFGADAPGGGHWLIAGTRIDPAGYGGPALVVVPQADRLVPAAVSAPLAAALPLATRLDVPLGHIGMIVGSQAKPLLWRPLRQWLAEHAGQPCPAAPAVRRRLAQSGRS